MKKKQERKDDKLANNFLLQNIGKMRAIISKICYGMQAGVKFFLDIATCSRNDILVV